MYILNKGTPGELEKRVEKCYIPIFLEKYKQCKNDISCTKFMIYAQRDIDAGPIERTLTKCAKDNNLTLEQTYSDYSGRDYYTFSFA